MVKILFVCHGNICRSTMAEFVMKHLVKISNLEDKYYIESAATSREEIGNDIHYGTKQKLKEENIPFTKHSARQITIEDYQKFDYIIGMDSYNINNIIKIIKYDKDKKVYKLLDFAKEKRDIADPWYTGNFDKTYEDILEGCKNFLKFLES